MHVGDERQQGGEVLTALGDAEFGCLLDGIDRVAAGIREPDDLRLRGLRLQQEGREVRAGEGVAHLAQDLAAILLDHGSSVAFERVTEGIIGGEEEPRVAAGLHDRFAGAVGERPGVIGPVDRIGSAFGAGQIRGRCAGDEKYLVLVAYDLVDCERNGGRRHVDDYIDLVDVDPGAHDVRADVRLVLMIGTDDSTFMPLAAAPKSSTAIRAAMTEPWPLRSEYVPDMSFMTPILMLPSLYCACAQPHPNTTASAVRPNNRFIRHPPVQGF